MPNKIQEYSLLVERAAIELTASHQSWLSFLQTASRLYKYQYNEQLMIHAQRPDATACADFDTWNSRMGRYVRKGSHGIGLIDASGDTPKMRYVFDVSDTVETNRARQLNIWEYKPEHIEAVSEALEKEYGIEGVWNLPILLDRTAAQLVDEYWRENKRDIFDIVADSYLEGYDEFNIEMQFRNAATVSIGYVLLNRCGVDPESYYTREDFLSVFDFNTPEAANALGTAVSEISRQVLRQLERTIRNYERSVENERTELQDSGRLPDTGNESQRDIADAAGQVRENEEDISSGAEADTVESDAAVGDLIPAYERDRRDSSVETVADDDGAYEVGGSDGADEGRRPDEVDGTYEQPESPGGGNHPQRPDLQLTFFPSEEEQKEIINQAEDMGGMSFLYFVRQEDIDLILQNGSNMSPARSHVITEFSKGKSIAELAEFLKSEYRGGYGLKGENGAVAAWYSDDGIRLCYGRDARYSKTSTLLSWEDAAERISQLLESGQFASNVELAEAPLNERTELAESLWYLYRDLSEEAHKEGYLDVMESVSVGGFPDEPESLAKELENADFRHLLTEQFAAFWTAREQDKSLLRFNYHKLDKIYTSLRELDFPRKEYSTEMAELPAIQSFITDDEIAQNLADGGNTEGSKGRIYEYFQGTHTINELAAFLKEEYGTGGRSHALSGSAHSSEDHSAKGIRLKKDGCIEVQLNWTDAARRVSDLIRKDRYLTPMEHDKYDALHEASTAYNSVKEQNPDNIVLYQVGDFFEIYGEDAKIAAPELDLHLTSKNIPGTGRVDMCGIPAHRLESYVEKLREEHDVTISAVNAETHERHAYTLVSTDHEAENAMNEYEAEFGADGTRVFHNTAPATPTHEITQGEIDAAIQRWNGSIESKRAVVRYMEDHGRERETASWLANEFGTPNSDAMPVTDTSSLPWSKVQRRIAQLIKDSHFYTEEEYDNLDDVDPVAIREHLAESGIVFGEVTDEELLSENPFIQQVRSDVEAISAGEAELSGEHMEKITEAFEAAGFSYDDINSYGGYLVFNGEGASYTFDSWEEAKEWIDNVIFDEPERNEAAEKVLHPERYQDDPYRQSRELITSYLEAEYPDEDPASAFEDYHRIPLAYSTDGDGNAEFQVYADIVENRIDFLANDAPLPSIEFINRDKLNEYLANMSFDEMIGYAESEYGKKQTVKIALSDAEFAQKNLIPGETSFQIDGRSFTVDSVNTDMGTVSLRDNTFAQSVGFPIFRNETIAFVRQYLETEPEYTIEPVAVYPAAENNLPYGVVIQTLKTHEPEHTAKNFHITDVHLGEGGPKAKFRMNMDAIKLLKELELENRDATPEEQAVLSKYVGWGGLADAYDEGKTNWANEFAELKSALAPEEYAAARASTLNAHYTSPVVIEAIYEAVGNMGFQTGNILEPAMGVGNFFGLLPEEMQNSKLYGVELDSLTGRIAQKLYPQADITVAGFETTDRRDFYDLAIGNVPFGQYQVDDKAYNKLGFSIHDYFFVKAIDQVRPGGVIAFVTSRYTMDKQSPEVRKYIAQRAEFIGAIRLPNTAFKENAGTDVVSDIIFLQKRDRPVEIEPDWVHLGRNWEGYSINSYFIDNPHMVLGKETSESTQYGRNDYTVVPHDEGTLAEHLHEAIKYIQAEYREAELPDIGDSEAIDTSIPADPNVKNFSYTVVDGEVYFRENSRMVKPELNATAQARVKGMVELRDCVHKLIDMQMDSFTPDSVIVNAQSELNELYSRFTDKYGLINSRANSLAFADDSSYYLLCSLEIIDEDGNLERKADMFSKRTIKPHRAVDSVDTSSEALAVSIAEKAHVDMQYMMQLTGKAENKIVNDLRGVIFLNPMFGFAGKAEKYLTADEYLSGNVREKLATAKRSAELYPDDYNANVEALQAVQPVDLDASEIEVRLGATWIGKEYIQQFMYETFETPMYLKYAIQVNYSSYTSEWNISGKSHVSWNNVAAYMTYGTEAANAYKILEDTLNLRDVRIYDTVRDPDGKERRVLNSKQTTLAQQKQQAIKDAFQEWIWRDPVRRHDLVTKYNELFNSNRPREYDGSHIVFSGMNPEIRLREHQLNAVAHVLYGGNTLLAHEVGAGKTFEMIASAMESKRLGLCQKALFAVPNHLTDQWAAEFLRLYPSANILVATKKDFETKNRKKFCARIATGDYDAVIIGHSQFERIPVSQDRQERLIHEQIDEITEGISEAKASRAERFTIKSMERTRRGLETKLKKLQDSPRDDVVTFEQLGVDRLLVDEAHNFKNLFLYTKMRNVAGLSTTDAQKSSDMYLKCRYIDELTEGKGIIFATGTPVSNSMTELYTMMRYLQHDLLHRKGLNHFDEWASAFGETVTAIELAPEGTGYRARTRFARFYNLPELMRLFKDAADIKTADQLNLPTPKAIHHTEVSQPTEIQKEMVKELSERASRVHAGIVNATEDNMLKVTSDGRKLGLDQRVINLDLPDDPRSKVNKCVDNVYRIWDEGQADKLTQIIFCDLSTPKGIKTEGKKAAKSVMGNLDSPDINALIGKDTIEEDTEFSVYDDIRKKLVERGIPREQIAFIHEANTEVRKKELFSKVRTGQVRVLMGSTSKMGTGTNVQDRLIALHDLDAPWRPGDLEQRSGRIIRQGNKNPEVHIYRYVTESTFDAYLWQTLENKQKFISQIMTSKSPVRSCEDVDETALSFAEIKALCAGDDRIKEKMSLDVDVAKLKLLKANHQSQQYRLEDNILKEFPKQVDENKGYIEGFKADIATLAEHPHPTDGFVGMEVKGDKLIDKDNAGAAILETFKDVKGLEPIQIGSYRGFNMFLSVEDFGKKFMLTLKGKMSHRVELGKDARGNLIRIDNALGAMNERMNAVQARLDSIYEQIEAAKLQLGKPFPQEEELRVKSARLAELNIALNMDNRSPMGQLVDDDSEEIAKAMPSISERLQMKNEYSNNKGNYKEEER